MNYGKVVVEIRKEKTYTTKRHYLSVSGKWSQKYVCLFSFFKGFHYYST